MTDVFPTLVVLLLWFTTCAVNGEMCKQQCHWCSSCKNAQNPCGDVFADNCNKYFYGDIVNITCQLKGNYTSANSSGLYLDIGNSNSGEIMLLDEKTAVFQHTLSPTDKKIINCKYNETYLGKIQFLYLDYYPQEITNFSCEWLGLEKLSCKWEHPVAYEISNFINVTFEWGMNGKPKICPDIVNFTRCDNISVTFLPYDSHFRINVTNTSNQKQKTASNTTKIVIRDPHYNFAKPYPIWNLTVLEMNRTEMKIGWNFNKGNFEFTVKYKPKHGKQMIILSSSDANDLPVVLQNLSVYTEYEVEVTAKFYSLSQRKKPCVLRSDPVTMTTRTSQDVARFSPETRKGGYTQEIFESTGIRSITVYWKFFDAMEDFGPIVKYSASLVKEDGSIIAGAEVPGTQLSYTFLNVSVDSVLHVNIRAGTEIGFSENSSPIDISEGNLKPPTMLLERKNEKGSTYYVSWIPQNNTDITGFTVYWCDKRNGCQNNINWERVSRTESSHVVKDLVQEYMFAVSMETPEASSGFKWQSCYYIREKIPSIPDSIQVQSKDQSSITLVWSRPNCGELSPFIKLYNLSWCPVEDDNSCKKGKILTEVIYSEVNSIYLTYKITDLHSATTYTIWAFAVTSAGVQSSVAVRYNVTTAGIPMNGDSGTLLMSLLIPVFVIIMIAILLLCLSYRYGWGKRIKDCLFPDVNIDNIEIKPTNHKNPSFGVDNFAVESEDNNNLSRVHSKSDQLTQIKADCKIDDGYKKVNELGHLMPSYLSKAEQDQVYPDADLSKSLDILESCEELLSLLPSLEIPAESHSHLSDLHNDNLQSETTSSHSVNDIDLQKEEDIESASCEECTSNSPIKMNDNGYMAQSDLTNMSRQAASILSINSGYGSQDRKSLFKEQNLDELPVASQELKVLISSSDYVPNAILPRESYSSSGIGTYTAQQRTNMARILENSHSSLSLHNSGYSEKKLSIFTVNKDYLESDVHLEDKWQRNEEISHDLDMKLPNNQKLHLTYHTEGMKCLHFEDLPITSPNLNDKNTKSLEVSVNSCLKNNSLISNRENSNSDSVQSYCALPIPSAKNSSAKKLHNIQSVSFTVKEVFPEPPEQDIILDLSTDDSSQLVPNETLDIFLKSSLDQATCDIPNGEVNSDYLKI